jgi:hypothetical protein
MSEKFEAKISSKLQFFLGIFHSKMASCWTSSQVLIFNGGRTCYLPVKTQKHENNKKLRCGHHQISSNNSRIVEGTATLEKLLLNPLKNFY